MECCIRSCVERGGGDDPTCQPSAHRSRGIGGVHTGVDGRRSPHCPSADRELLASAIATTRGSYLVYNFGGGSPAPMLNAGGGRYEMSNGGHLMIVKAASQRLRHGCWSIRTPATNHAANVFRRAYREGLRQASEVYTPLQAWQVLGQPTIAINANFFDIRGQNGGSWKATGCRSPLGAYVDNTRGNGRANAAVTGTIAYAGKQALSGGNENWTALTTMILPVGGAPFVVPPSVIGRLRRGNAGDHRLMDKGVRFVAVSGLGLLAPGDTGQLNDPGPSAARTAIAYAREKDEMYVFQGGSYTPDQIQDLFRALGSDVAILLDGGGSSAIVLRRDSGGMWAGAGAPKGMRHLSGALQRPRARPAELARLQLGGIARRAARAGVGSLRLRISLA